MRFWDTSALVPLLINEQGSKAARQWLQEDDDLVLWTLTPTELCSAIWRRARAGRLTEEQARELEQRVAALSEQASLIGDVDGVKRVAARLLRVHPLRAADALQLAAALAWAEGDPRARVLHTLDVQLAAAARREGFDVP